MRQRVGLTVHGEARQSQPESAVENTRPAIVALIGNPNTGKTTLFNALTGFRRHVANYPGVTVELARGPIRGTKKPLELLDLPGTYSLAAVAPDEMIVADLLTGCAGHEDAPDAIIAILDATNLERNMYLLSQLVELSRPIVVALNMTDLAQRRGIMIDAARLGEHLGCKVVPIVATHSETLKPLLRAVEEAVGGPPPTARPVLPGLLMEHALHLSDGMPCTLALSVALRVLVDRGGYAERDYLRRGGSTVLLERARGKLADVKLDAAAAEVTARYAWIRQMLAAVIERRHGDFKSASDRIDAVLTHPVAGSVILLGILFIVFQAIFRWADPLMQGIGMAFDWLGQSFSAVLPEGVVQSLVVDGVIGGVGGVLTFLPQILILFALIAILEDCGYMARAAFMMDRLMRTLGLSGRAFIPMLSSYACAVPAIMGTRTIADRHERFVTILLAPFMSCSARLPVYILMISAFVPSRYYLAGWISLGGLIMFAMYMVGAVVAIPVAWLLKSTAFAGPQPGFVMELPTYKRPRTRAILQRMWLSGRSFVVNAGSIILLVSIVVWALAYFPHGKATQNAVQQRAAVASWDAERTSAELEGAYLRESYLGQVGRLIEPTIKPLGWDWRIGMAVIASFPAREVVIGTMGTIFNLGRGQDQESVQLKEALQRATWPESGKPVFTLPVALSLMVFFALCAQCASTLVMIGRETRSWGWPVASFLGMTTIAYFAALLTARVAMACGL